MVCAATDHTSLGARRPLRCITLPSDFTVLGRSVMPCTASSPQRWGMQLPGRATRSLTPTWVFSGQCWLQHEKYKSVMLTRLFCAQGNV